MNGEDMKLREVEQGIERELRIYHALRIQKFMGPIAVDYKQILKEALQESENNLNDLRIKADRMASSSRNTNAGRQEGDAGRLDRMGLNPEQETSSGVPSGGN